jgi:hypothetical protein
VHWIKNSVRYDAERYLALARALGFKRIERRISVTSDSGFPDIRPYNNEFAAIVMDAIENSEYDNKVSEIEDRGGYLELPKVLLESRKLMDIHGQKHLRQCRCIILTSSDVLSNRSENDRVVLIRASVSYHFYLTSFTEL